MSIKVTDRRMFTEDGQLRPEYSEQAEETTEESPSSERKPPESKAPEPPVTEAPVAAPPNPGGRPAGEPEAQAVPSTQAPPSAPSQSAPAAQSAASAGEPLHPAAQLLEIVQMLVEPAMLFMGEAPMPDGQTVTDLERSRIYIDLLAVLEEKTKGNLTNEEERVLGDVLYQLRMRFVQKKG